MHKTVFEKYDLENKLKIPQKKQSIANYHKLARKKKLIGLMMLAAVFLLSLVAINAGSSKIDPFQVLLTIFGHGEGNSSVVIWNIRLPRVVSAVVAGAGLSVAGCVMQNNLRNPLAEPTTLGISHAAAFGANIAIILWGAGSIQSTSGDAVIISNPYMVTVSAFFWAMVATMVILALARFRGFAPETIVLAGVALNFLFMAGTTIIQYFADDVQIAASIFWTFGDLGRSSWPEVAIMVTAVFLSLIYFIIKRWDYNALAVGEESAKGLGVNVEYTRFFGTLLASAITAVTVSFLGIIGFIGLLGPHMMRRIIGEDHRFLIPISALAGSVLLLIADTLARTIISPVILPVGAITSFLGAPLFLYLLMRGYEKK
ncbi:iron ABC transporter permease [Desulfoscipio sp. XC116]|uniref:FecCD family ABC transporter permease n=1 Tax=Desulfoscipio sp. XC116 TaxID=3144975 RepID=UPI00325A556D